MPTVGEANVISTVYNSFLTVLGPLAVFYTDVFYLFISFLSFTPSSQRGIFFSFRVRIARIRTDGRTDEQTGNIQCGLLGRTQHSNND